MFYFGEENEIKAPNIPFNNIPASATIGMVWMRAFRFDRSVK